jgi:hypothetical protein
MIGVNETNASLNLNIRVTVARAAIVEQATPGIMTHKDAVDAWGKGSVSVGVD